MKKKDDKDGWKLCKKLNEMAEKFRKLIKHYVIMLKNQS